MTDTTLSPSARVSTLISLQNGHWYPTFAVPLNILFVEYFTPAFGAAWVAAAAYNDTFPVCDGDPITGYFGVTSLTLVGSSVDSTSDTTCTVTATVRATLGDASISNLVKNCTVTFSLALTDGRWLIDDIDQGVSSYDAQGVYAKHPSLRTYFTQVPAIAATCSTPAPSITALIDPTVESTDGLVART